MPREPMREIVAGVDDSLDPAALLSRSAGASLLMPGRGDRGRGRRAGERGSGSLAATVLGGATVPVVICPNGSAHAGDAPVVVGIDGTPGSEAAVRFGFAEADLRRAPLIAMHLWPPLSGPMPDDAGASAAEDAFLDLLETWSGKYPDVPVRLAVRHGVDAAIVLAAASRSAQLVVVASAAPDAAASPMLAALAVRAACAVAVVPSAG